MNCPSCHIVVDGDSRFCKHCGTSLTGGKTAAAGPVAPNDPLTAAAKNPAADAFRDPAQEKDVWQGRPAWQAYYGTWLLWAVVVVIVLVLTYRWTTSVDKTARMVMWAIVGGGAVALWVRQALIIYGLHFQLSTQRLVIRRGILSRTTDQIELVRVDDVRFRQGLIDRIVKTGDVEVISSDATDAKLVLQSILNPDKVAEDVRRNVRGARGKGSLFVENV